MIISEKVNVKIVGKNIRHYKALGYNDIKRFDIIEIPMTHLTKGSHVKIVVKCDYCKKLVNKEYKALLSERKNSPVDKDCCLDCAHVKAKETSLLLYGVENTLQREETKDKIKKTTQKKYGVEYISQSKNIKMKVANKIKNRSAEEKSAIRKKREKTTLERYGFSCMLTSPKSRTRLFETQTKASFQQIEVFKMIKKEYKELAKFNFTYSHLCLDVFLKVNEQKIDIEYDSSYWHNPKQDRKRDEFLKSEGFKILRIKSGKKIPEKTILINKINGLLLSNKKYATIVLSDWNPDSYAYEGRAR